MKRPLYITFDGLLEPLGTSQIVRPLLGLADRGIPYVVVSLEKPNDLDQVAALRSHLARSGIEWRYGIFHEGGGAAQVARNIATVTHLALTEARRPDIGLLHPRAHLSAAVAWLIGRFLGMPYLFDFRGYWVDEQLELGRWVTRPAAYQVAKLGERQLVCDAAGLVCLTDLARQDIRAGAFGPFPAARPVETITTVADYGEMTRNGPVDKVPEAVRARLAGKLVIAYIGAINVSYAYDAALELVRRLIAIRDDTHLLCLTRQTESMHSLLRDHGIPNEHATVSHAPHTEMAQWLRLVDWCLLLLNAPYAKRGSMPTKLGELFAAEVRLVQHGCNSEVSDWVRQAGSGLVLDTLTQDALNAAAAHIATTPRDSPALARARDITAAHFDSRAGVERYARLIERLLSEASAIASPSLGASIDV